MGESCNLHNPSIGGGGMGVYVFIGRCKEGGSSTSILGDHLLMDLVIILLILVIILLTDLRH